MKPSAGINCKEEYEISKAILLSFLDSPSLKSKFHPSGIQEIKEYVLGVIAQESTHLAYERMTIFNQEVYTNCGHEATNHAIKYMTNPVTPQDSLGTAIDKIAIHDALLMFERHLKAVHEYRKHKAWTSSWQELTTNSACIILGHEKQSMKIK